jgi:ribosome-associated protein
MNISIIKKSIRNKALASVSRSPGPGGQNVNKVNTKVTLKIRLADIEGLNAPELERAKSILQNRLTGEGEIVTHAFEERSRLSNFEKAYLKLYALVITAAKLPKKRIVTKPSKKTVEKRLAEKQLLSIKKKTRSKNNYDYNDN